MKPDELELRLMKAENSVIAWFARLHHSVQLIFILAFLTLFFLTTGLWIARFSSHNVIARVVMNTKTLLDVVLPLVLLLNVFPAVREWRQITAAVISLAAVWFYFLGAHWCSTIQVLSFPA